MTYPCHPCCCHCPYRYPPPRCPPPHHHHYEADALDVLDVLAKTPGLYLVPELRYPCHCCCPCCRCPPSRHRPPHCRHHHEADALDVLDVHAKTPGLYQVPKQRNLNLNFFLTEGRREGRPPP